MRILVTGSAGFIGFHLSKSLLDDGYEVLGIDNLNAYYDRNLKHARLDQITSFKNFTFKKIDIADRESLTKAFTDFRPQKVVNLAAQAGVRYSIENPYAYMDANLVGFLNIIELCRHNDVESLIYASSSSVYGGNKKSPFDVLDRVDNPISLYAATKKANELIANAYSHLYGLRTTGLRFFTVYGPWGRPDMAMFLFTDKILKDKPIQVFNHGDMKRDFTFIDDIISGTRSAIDNNYKCEIFNLGNSRSEQLMDIVHLIEENLGKKAKIEFMPMQPGDVPESFADIKKSIDMLNYKPTTNIDVGISEFINWYKERY
ncbi:MAG: NAD-dependent epimerase/dehydratase family protein [Candidatus Marinimicrobia bacterium]|jgi:UDP-glucuronate 4-epimerase|nr:NAD-dependent epimerase/dehydratase family protein [Candidatus Neomarinimicrobiota bacterium]